MSEVKGGPGWGASLGRASLMYRNEGGRIEGIEQPDDQPLAASRHRWKLWVREGRHRDAVRGCIMNAAVMQRGCTRDEGARERVHTAGVRTRSSELHVTHTCKKRPRPWRLARVTVPLVKSSSARRRSVGVPAQT
eukprot:7377850-Prymnesium_polylepis.1